MFIAFYISACTLFWGHSSCINQSRMMAGNTYIAATGAALLMMMLTWGLVVGDCDPSNDSPDSQVRATTRYPPYARATPAPPTIKGGAAAAAGEFAGPAGYPGYPGPPGRTGAPGLAGNAGAPGRPGSPAGTYFGGEIRRGATGAPGRPGIGATGTQGFPGRPGPRGATGSRGLAGAKGAPGQQGNMGSFGAVGGTGFTGDIGPQGPKGYPGRQGPSGKLNGAHGATGSTGATGFTGYPGPQGVPGAPGYDYNVPAAAAITANEEACASETTLESAYLLRLSTSFNIAGLALACLLCVSDWMLRRAVVNVDCDTFYREKLSAVQ